MLATLVEGLLKVIAGRVAGVGDALIGSTLEAGALHRGCIRSSWAVGERGTACLLVRLGDDVQVGPVPPFQPCDPLVLVLK